MTILSMISTGWLLALVPLALGVLVVTFEVGMALTIGNLPRHRGNELTAEQKARIKRVWIGVGLFWPMIGLLVVLHLFLPMVLLPGVWLGLAIAAGFGVRRIMRQGRSVRRVKEGRCESCGYDLRGSTHCEDCPECGVDLHPQALEVARRISA